MLNKYGVAFPEGEKSLAYNWLGAKVEFVLLGQKVSGMVQEVDHIGSTVTAGFHDGDKAVLITANWRAFKKVEV